MDKISISNILLKDESEILQNNEYLAQSSRNKKDPIQVEIESIIKNKKEQRLNKLRLYKDKLNKCVRQIKRKDELGVTDMIFHVEALEYGYPEYEQDECVDYLIIELRKYGFDIKKINNSEIFISWKFLELNVRNN